ncbi:MAG: N-acetylmuramoyl-L-alanine amidase family protein [Bacteroidales bacterium]
MHRFMPQNKDIALLFRKTGIWTAVFLFFVFIPHVNGTDIGNSVSVVVIDAGHGGEDPGALGKMFKEKEITLAIALKLGKCIEETYPTVKVIYTRKTDVFIPLHERAEIANKNHADLFISIHANATKNTEVYGMETYAMGLHTNEKNLEVAKKENAVIIFEKDYTLHYEGYDPNSPESFIIFSLMQNTYLAQSLDFAGHVQSYAKDIARRNDRGVKQAGFLVLWKTTMPSVLIEVGYITHPDEEKYLGSEEGQMQIATAICKAFGEYKQKIESNSKLTVANSTLAIDTNRKTNQPASAVSNDSVIFRVQVFSLPKPLSPTAEQIKKCKKVLGINRVDEIYFNNYYKYVVGATSNYSEIQKLAREVKKHYPEAFIIALKGDSIVPLGTILKK